MLFDTLHITFVQFTLTELVLNPTQELPESVSDGTGVNVGEEVGVCLRVEVGVGFAVSEAVTVAEGMGV